MINDFFAGLSDLLALPTDVASLGMGAIKYPFKKVFTDSENPFAEGVANSWAGQASQGIRDFNSDVFESDPESSTRRAGTDVGGFALDLFTGGSGKIARAGTKAVIKGQIKKGLPLLGRAVADTAITNTAINAGMSLLSGEGLTPTEGVIAGAGVLATPSFLQRQARKLSKRANIINQANAQTMVQKKRRAMQAYDLVDERSGAVDLAKLDGLELDDSFRLSPEDIAREDPILVKATEELKQFNPTLADETNRFAQLESELEQRLQAPVTAMSNDLILPDEIQRARKVAASLGLQDKPLTEVRDILYNSKRDDLISMMNKYPTAFPETGYIDPLTGAPISNAKLLQEIERSKNNLGAEMNKVRDFFGRNFRADLKAQLDSGLISKKTYDRELNKSLNIGYIPKAAKDSGVGKTREFSGVGSAVYDDLAATETGAGVLKQQNAFKTAMFNLNRNAVNRVLNAKTKELVSKIEQQLPQLKLANKKLIQDTQHKLRTATDDYTKKLLSDDLTFYKKREADLLLFNKNKVKDANQIPVKFFSDGVEKTYYFPEDYTHSLLKGKVKTNNNIVKGIQSVHTALLPFRTGKWNVFNFGPVKWAYGLWEIMPAIVSEAAKRGQIVPYHKVMLEQLAQTKNAFANEYYNWLINGIKRSGSKLWFTADDIPNLEAKIKKAMTDVHVSPVDNFAEISRAGASNLFDAINPDTATKFDYLASKASSAWNWVDRSAPVEFLRILNQSISDSASNTIIKMSRDLFKDPDEMRDFVLDVSRKTSDTRRRGAGLSKTGKALNLIEDVVPYGKSIVQGTAGKLDYFDLGKNADIIKNIIHNNSGFDTLTSLMTVMANKVDGPTFDMLWKIVVAPTAITYLWNNMTPDQSEDYHELNSMTRSKTRMLMNFGGRGIHAYFPVDQEWSLLSNITEAILDAAFNMSENDPNNPDWSYREQVLKSAGRVFGLEFPIPVNIATKAMGFSVNPNVEALAKNEVLKPNVPTGFASNVEAVLGETLGMIGNAVGALSSNRPFNTDMLGQIPLISNAFSQEHHNSTSAFVDSVYRKDPANFPLKDLMTKRKYMESRLRHFKQTGKTMAGQDYNMPRQKVIETITHNIQKLNGEMYKQLKEKG